MSERCRWVSREVSQVPAFLLHLRSSVSIRHVEDDFDEFEQVIIPDEHYALSREGRTANYLVVPERPVDDFHAFLSRHASKFCIEQISLIEVGRSWRVIEQGSAAEAFGDEELPDVLDDESLAAVDACGEWHYARNDETRVPGQIRVRTGLDRWLHKHGRGSRQPTNPASAILLCFHNPLEENSRFLTHFRGALGKSSRPHLRDEKSVLLTWEGAGPRELFQQNRFQRYLSDPTIHTALGFSIGLEQKHTNGELQSVLPPSYRANAERPKRKSSRPMQKASCKPTLIPMAEPKVFVVREPSIDRSKLQDALVKLKSGRKSQ